MSREKDNEVPQVDVSGTYHHYYPGGCHVRFSSTADSCSGTGYQECIQNTITTSAPNDGVTVVYKIV